MSIRPEIVRVFNNKSLFSSSIGLLGAKVLDSCQIPLFGVLLSKFKNNQYIFMPFTLGGDWYPSENTRKTKPLLSIEKRRNTEVTLIKGLKLMPIEAEALLKTAKRELGCGGSYKDFVFLFQGNHLEKLKITLREMGFKI